CQKLGQVIVLWSDHPGDWLHPGPKAIEARGLRYLKPGVIILMHDTLPETVACLPDFIHRIRARGYQFVPITAFEPSIAGRGVRAPPCFPPLARPTSVPKFARAPGASPPLPNRRPGCPPDAAAIRKSARMSHPSRGGRSPAPWRSIGRATVWYL